MLNDHIIYNAIIINMSRYNKVKKYNYAYFALTKNIMVYYITHIYTYSMRINKYNCMIRLGNIRKQ